MIHRIKSKFFLLIFLLILASCKTNLDDIKLYGKEKKIDKLRKFLESNIYDVEKLELNKEAIKQILLNDKENGINYLEKFFSNNEFKSFDKYDSYYEYFYKEFKNLQSTKFKNRLFTKISSKEISGKELLKIFTITDIKVGDYFVKELLENSNYEYLKVFLNSFYEIIVDTNNVKDSVAFFLDKIIFCDSILTNKGYGYVDSIIIAQEYSINDLNDKIKELEKEKSDYEIISTDYLEESIKDLTNDIREFERNYIRMSCLIGNVVDYDNGATYYLVSSGSGIVVLASSQSNFNTLDYVTVWCYRDRSNPNYLVSGNYGQMISLPLYFVADREYEDYLWSKKELNEKRKELNKLKAENKKNLAKINNINSKITNLEKKVETLMIDNQNRIEKIEENLKQEKNNNLQKLKQILEISQM